MRYFVGSLAGVVVVMVVALVAPSLDMPNPVSPSAPEETVDREDWVLGDQFGDIVAVETESLEARGEKQANKLVGRSDRPVEPSEPTYDARAQPWDALPPARVAESSDNCVGYCFDAVVASVDRDDARMARVVVFGEDGAPTRAVVERTSMTDQSRSAAYYGTAVRFTCFERANTAPVPRFKGCAQVAKETRDLGASKDGRSRKESDSNVFDLADPL